jgi:transposase-like protein
MFEDETIDIACPSCEHTNPVLVREFETSGESHIVCQNCKAAVKIEAQQFRERLDRLREEVEDMQREAERGTRRAKPRRSKDDYQI